MYMEYFLFFFFFFNDTATTEIYTLSLHDALPIWRRCVAADGESDPGLRADARRARPGRGRRIADPGRADPGDPAGAGDRKSTRLNSSHANISYAVFCLKKKNNISPFLTVTP